MGFKLYTPSKLEGPGRIDQKIMPDKRTFRSIPVNGHTSSPCCRIYNFFLEQSRSAIGSNREVKDIGNSYIFVSHYIADVVVYCD